MRNSSQAPRPTRQRPAPCTENSAERARCLKLLLQLTESLPRHPVAKREEGEAQLGSILGGNGTGLCLEHEPMLACAGLPVRPLSYYFVSNRHLVLDLGQNVHHHGLLALRLTALFCERVKCDVMALARASYQIRRLAHALVMKPVPFRSLL